MTELTMDFAGVDIGEEYYTSDWFQLDEDHLRQFSYSTYLDPQHVDLTISKNNPYGADLVDGFWMVSMLLYFNFKYGRRESDKEYGFNYGLNKVRFTAPLMLGERIRLTLVNDTMMNHPMHLHGMWMELENGRGASVPRVHTVNVKPAERVSLLFTADAPGPWAFHCHVLYHMEAGMFRVFHVMDHGSAAPEHGATG